MVARSVRHSVAACVLLSWVLGHAPATAASHDSKPTVTGTATYHQRVTLTPGAVFEAALLDVSRADAPSEVIASVRRVDPGAVPIAFSIAYDPHRIAANRKYAVRATIHEQGRLSFTSDPSYPVLTHGHGDRIKIVMRAASGGSRPAPSLGALPASFTGLLPCADCAGIRYQIDLLAGDAFVQRTTYLRDHDHSYYELGRWSLSGDGRTLSLLPGDHRPVLWAVRDPHTIRKLDAQGKPIDSKLPYDLARDAGVGLAEPRLAMRGMFVDVADAPRFRECVSGLEWPVATAGDYRALERAYTAQRSAPGVELLVSIAGRVERRVKADGVGTTPTLVVEKFVRAMPAERCGASPEQPGIADSRWRPVRIGGRPVTVAEGGREPWIVLDSRAGSVTGSGGCNRLSGSYEAGEDTLRLGPLITTKMACPGVDFETPFLRALADTRRYRVAGRTLELMDDRGRVLAVLEERNLK